VLVSTGDSMVDLVHHFSVSNNNILMKKKRKSTYYH